MVSCSHTVGFIEVETLSAKIDELSWVRLLAKITLSIEAISVTNQAEPTQFALLMSGD